jgi:RecA-family ATPase
MQSKVTVTAAADVELDLQANIDRAVTWLKSLEPPVDGSRNDTGYKIACRVCRDMAISGDKAVEIIEEHWNSRGLPPMKLDEVRAVVKSAGGYGQNAVGTYAVAPASEVFKHALDKLPPPEQATNDVTAIRPVPLSEVLTRAVSPVQELIPGLIERGTVTFLSAPGGSHKSRLAMQFGLCLDAGVPVFGRSVKQVPYVYVGYEDHPDEVTRRSQAIARRLKLPLDRTGQVWELAGKDAPLAIVNENGAIDYQPFWKVLYTSLRAIPGHKFVVLDSTYNAVRFAGAAKINEGAVMNGIALLQHLCDTTDSTVLALWHPSVAGQERGDASGWSVAWHNAPRARLSLTAIKDSDSTYELKVEKRNHGAKGKPLTLHWSDGALLPLSQAADAETAALFRETCIRIALQAAEKGTPIIRQRHLYDWQVDEIERAIGRRPTQREVKEVLSQAVGPGGLRYLKGHGKQMAGYFAFDDPDADPSVRRTLAVVA